MHMNLGGVLLWKDRDVWPLLPDEGCYLWKGLGSKTERNSKPVHNPHNPRHSLLPTVSTSSSDNYKH